ncbi:MAG: hypothetical protein ABI599_01320 [Flavobacteriales bacterium]
MRTLLITCLVGCCMLAQGQARNNNWVFANKWLSFNNDTTTLPPLAYHPSFRNACISDTAGNFLLLVDDNGVRDNTFGLMPNGTAADLGYSGEQGNYLVLPKPGDPQGYVVMVNSREDLKRAGVVEVNMSLNGGLGAVSMPLQWYMDSTTAKLAATPHGNGTDYWILQHEDGTNEFHAYQLTTTGVDPTPVISHVGTPFQPSDTSAANADFWGPMKFNVQGDMIAMANMDPFATDTATEIQLFRFDDLSGTVTSLASIDHRYTELLGGNPVVYYNYRRQTGGLEFDASGTHLYSFTWDCLPPQEYDGLFQSNLDVLADDPIQTSTIFVFNGPVALYTFDNRGSSLELAPDGRIFFRHSYYPGRWGWLVNLPDYLGSTIVQSALFPNSQDTTAGFPNFCKRYHDSEPVWLRVDEPPTGAVELSVHPNPMEGYAWLHLPMNAAVPDHLIWTDALGRNVRSEAPMRQGTSLALERRDLPSGMYVVQVLRQQERIGYCRVLVQ